MLTLVKQKIAESKFAATCSIFDICLVKKSLQQERSSHKPQTPQLLKTDAPKNYLKIHYYDAQSNGAIEHQIFHL